MDMQKVAERSWEENIRIEKIYMLSMFSDCIPLDFVEEIRDGDFHIEDVLGECPEGYFAEKSPNKDKSCSNFSDCNCDEMSEAILSTISDKNRYGFFAKVTKPVMNRNGFYSWGHYQIKWVYADTIEELVQASFNVFNNNLKVNKK